jgi:hypothetical protein
MTAGDPRRSPSAAIRNLTDELNTTLRSTVTEHPLVSQVTGDWAHIAFSDDRPVQLDRTHWLHIILDLYLGEFDRERAQFRNHIIKAIFTYLDSDDRKTGPVLEYHLHKMDLRGAEAALVPHLHVRTADGRRDHIYVGRCCLEDLLEYLIREEGVAIVPYKHPRGQAMTPSELFTRATGRLHEGRSLFHSRFKTWHGMTPLSELPEKARAILEQIR